MNRMIPLLSSGLLAAAACNDTQIVVGGLQEVTSLRAIPNRDLDILFVVDNSPSMIEEQMSLVANFPRMMAVLEQLDGGLPNLHIGVVTSDMGTLGGPQIGSGRGSCTERGDDGVLQHNAPELSGNFIIDVDEGGARTRNYTGNLADVFTKIATVGQDGCGFEQHLGAMRRGLSNPLNAGFLRPEANLAIVILADEDDCSALSPALFAPEDAQLGPLASFRCFEHGVECAPDAPRQPGEKTDCRPRADSTLVEDIQPFVDGLIALKGDPRKVMVGAIVGEPAPVTVAFMSPPGAPGVGASCAFSGPNGQQLAYPAVRLAAFLDRFDYHPTLTSICNEDLSAPLGEIGQSAKALIGDPCIDTTLLTDTLPDVPGVQAACEASDMRDSAPDVFVPIPHCNGASTDCFQLVEDPIACPSSADHIRLRVDRSGLVSDDTWIHVRCQYALQY